MDFVKNLAAGGSTKDGQQPASGTGEGEHSKASSGGFMDKLNSAAGGGAAGEKKEDGLDKGKWTSTTHRDMSLFSCVCVYVYVYTHRQPPQPQPLIWCLADAKFCVFDVKASTGCRRMC